VEASRACVVTYPHNGAGEYRIGRVRVVCNGLIMGQVDTMFSKVVAPVDAEHQRLLDTSDAIYSASRPLYLITQGFLCKLHLSWELPKARSDYC
jgi:hypothetical protein